MPSFFLMWRTLRGRTRTTAAQQQKRQVRLCPPHCSAGRRRRCRLGGSRPTAFSRAPHPDPDATPAYPPAFLQEYERLATISKKVGRAVATRHLSQQRPTVALNVGALNRTIAALAELQPDQKTQLRRKVRGLLLQLVHNVFLMHKREGVHTSLRRRQRLMRGARTRAGAAHLRARAVQRQTSCASCRSHEFLLVLCRRPGSNVLCVRAGRGGFAAECAMLTVLAVCEVQEV